jgi:uroporphyrinogen-III synthase
MSLPLSGVGVLVTRPAGQAAALMRRLKGLGGEPLHFPALAIFPLRSEALLATLASLDAFDLAVFVSPTAVERGLAAFNQPWPTQLPAAGVGGGTARALKAAGISHILQPKDGADSEHLLALPELQQLAGKRVLIVRGEGGRELLADTLATRGAEVHHAVCYRRGCPEDDPTPLRVALAGGQLRAVTAMSSETLDHLRTLAGDKLETLLALPLFVPHARIADHARHLGFRNVRSTEAGEDGLLAGLVEYFRHD